MSDNDMVNMARLAQRDDRMATGKLYGDLADRIEELEREQSRLHTQCDGLMQAAMNNGQALILAEAKLAKAGIVALETILNERGLVFDAMVEAAEDAAGKDVSFNVVVGRAIRAALTMLAELEK